MVLIAVIAPFLTTMAPRPRFYPQLPRHLRASREGPGGLPEGHRVHHSSDGCRACQLLHSRGGEDGKVGRIFFWKQMANMSGSPTCPVHQLPDGDGDRTNCGNLLWLL